METKELYLKTLFCCCACDGEIAQKEISLIKEIINTTSMLKEMDVESCLNSYVEKINQHGKAFLNDYLDELSNLRLTEEEQITLVELAINMIEADNQVVYSEIKFFKKIRSYLSITDEYILNRLPDKGDYLLPDLLPEDKESEWSNIVFEPIMLH